MTAIKSQVGNAIGGVLGALQTPDPTGVISDSSDQSVNPEDAKFSKVLNRYLEGDEIKHDLEYDPSGGITAAFQIFTQFLTKNPNLKIVAVGGGELSGKIEVIGKSRTESNDFVDFNLKPDRK